MTPVGPDTGLRGFLLHLVAVAPTELAYCDRLYKYGEGPLGAEPAHWTKTRLEGGGGACAARVGVSVSPPTRTQGGHC